MNNKDFYSFMLKPTEREIRNEVLIDKLYNMRTLDIPKNIFLKNYGRDSSLNTGLITWKNQLISLKYYYATAKKKIINIIKKVMINLKKIFMIIGVERT